MTPPEPVMTPPDFSSLIRLYKRMDAAYDRVAAQYGFHCTGCADNCCTSLFFHHTFIEKAFLLQGFEQMAVRLRQEIRTRAADYADQTFAGGHAGRSLKLMCPLNLNGGCTLYAFRPMICRLHGLPHELHPPGRQAVRGPGCDAGRFDADGYIRFDRTPFYMDLAVLEQQFKHRHNLTGRPRLTIAQMLLNPDL
jgi:Fe-S-cluster containining protein